MYSVISSIILLYNSYKEYPTPVENDEEIKGVSVGLIIQEGRMEPPAQVEAFFKDAGWTKDIPIMAKKEHTLICQNSTWAFAVWDE